MIPYQRLFEAMVLSEREPRSIFGIGDKCLNSARVSVGILSCIVLANTRDEGCFFV